MDFIKECFNEHSSAFTEALTGTGFSADQAKQFLPEAASGIVDATQGAGIQEMIQVVAHDAPGR